MITLPAHSLSTAGFTFSECTAWILAPDANETGGFVLHKTRDWGEGQEVEVTLEIEKAPESKYRLLAFSPYMLFNEKGLGMADTSAPLTIDNTPGLEIIDIFTTMHRVTQNCATVQEALAMLEGFTKDGTNPKHDNYLLCDPKEAAIVELAPRHIAYHKVTSGFSVHTNHYIYPEILFISKGKLESKIKSATRLLVTQERLAAHLQEQGRITLENTMALSRYQDNENFPNMCPFRDSTVCATDYLPDAEYPGVLGTLRICPGPTRYAPALPIPMGATKIPECLVNGDFGKLAYRLKRAFPTQEHLVPRFEQLEQRLWKEYLANRADAKKLLEQGHQSAALERLQGLMDRQVQEAYSLMQSLQPAE